MEFKDTPLKNKTNQPNSRLKKNYKWLFVIAFLVMGISQQFAKGADNYSISSAVDLEADNDDIPDAPVFAYL